MSRSDSRQVIDGPWPPPPRWHRLRRWLRLLASRWYAVVFELVAASLYIVAGAALSQGHHGEAGWLILIGLALSAARFVSWDRDVGDGS